MVRKIGWNSKELYKNRWRVIPTKNSRFLLLWTGRYYFYIYLFIYKFINLIYISTYSFIIIIICASVWYLRLFDDTCSQHPVRVLHFADLCHYENDLFRWTFIFNAKPLSNFLNLYIFLLVIFLYHFSIFD